MDITFAVLADASNISREGKLNILGIFDTVYATRFPALHPTSQLVIHFEADVSEAGSKKSVEVQLVDADAMQLLSVSGEITSGKPRPGERFQANTIFVLNGLVFPHPGEYEFKVLINQELKKSVPLMVVTIPEDQPKPPA